MTDIAIPVKTPSSMAKVAGLGGQADLFHALVADAALAVDESGGDLFLAVPASSESAVAFVEDIRDTVLEDASNGTIVHVETDAPIPPVGSTLRAVRDRSTAASIGVLDPATALVGRRHLDTAAMRLRRDDVVLGPTPEAGYFFFGTALDPETLPERMSPEFDAVTTEAGERGSVGFLEMLPVVTRPDHVGSLAALVAGLNADNRTVAPFASAYFEERTDTS